MKRKMDDNFIFMDTGKIAKIHEHEFEVFPQDEEFNPVETILKNCGERGMSIKQLMDVLHFTKRKIKHFIYHSRFIDNTNPHLHGSGKLKINVYTFDKKLKDFYFKRKKEKKRNDFTWGELTDTTTD